MDFKELFCRMSVERSEKKAERYADTKRLISAVFAPVEETFNNGIYPAGYGAHVESVIGAWREVRKQLPMTPPRFPSGVLFQEFSFRLRSQAAAILPEDTAFDLGAWLEDKFIAGKHPFWSGFLERAVLKPCGIEPDYVMPGALLPIEGSIHALDDYIDTKHATPSASIMEVGLTAACLVLLPVLFKDVVKDSGDANSTDIAREAFGCFCSALDGAVSVPEIEDETPGLLRQAKADFEKEIEAAAFNINSRTRGTTGVFLSPLSALCPDKAERIKSVWEALWLARASEMCAKDAVFDVEADILNQDHTPASVWAEDFGVGSPEWCRRIDALYKRYLGLWRASASERASFPPDLTREVENKLYKNRFLIDALLPGKEQTMPPGLKGLKNIYMVGSGKGGVGKSTVAWLIANGIRNLGHRVGVIDADIWGPSQDILFRRKTAVSFNGDELVPEEKDGVTVVTLGQFVAQNDAILLRSVMAANLLKRMALSVRWPDLDYLIIDLPPGASDIHIQLCSIFPEAEIILVTLAQPLAIADTSRAMTIYTGLNKKVRGLILNMTEMTCSNCGGSNELGNSSWDNNVKNHPLGGLPLLARLPFDITLATHENGPQDAANESLRIRQSVETLSRSMVSQSAKKIKGEEITIKR